MRGAYEPPDAPVSAVGLRIGIVASRFNRDVVQKLVDGAVEAVVDAGAAEEAVEVHWVPGAFEVPVILRRLAETGRCDALVAVGAVVRGETPHFDFVAGGAADGCAAVAREFGIAVGFGIITTDTWEQAVDRAGGEAGNKGAEAALSAVETARLLRTIS